MYSFQHSPKFGKGTEFSAELQVSHEETKVVLITGNHIFPSLPIAMNLSIFFGQVSDISPGIMIQKKELFDGHILMENCKYVSFMLWPCKTETFA